MGGGSRETWRRSTFNTFNRLENTPNVLKVCASNNHKELLHVIRLAPKGPIYRRDTTRLRKYIHAQQLAPYFFSLRQDRSENVWR